MDLTEISYLKSGNPRQQLAYVDIQRFGLWTKLEAFRPVLCGTLPLEIDVEGSDLDIVCEAEDLAHAKKYIIGQFSSFPQFTIKQKEVRGEASLIGQFLGGHFPIELFVQNCPVTQQHAFRHMLIERHILSREGKDFKEKIIELKRGGMKTEPAFAQLLDLKGDPYEALLEYGKIHFEV